MTQEPSADYSALALKYASVYAGKIEMVPRVPVRGLDDFSVWYTPGVAAVSRAIQAQRDLSFEYTGRWNTIAVLTDGTRVLGLGDVGPEAAMPVMEGKALIFKCLGGVNAIPLAIGTTEPDKIIEVVKALQPGLGGVNLEDISSPKCFYLLEKLRQEMEVPVWHDDQQGTAGTTLAGLINALRLTGRTLRESRIVFFGAGAANIATANLLMAAGADAGSIILVDSKGILHPEREDIDQLLLRHRWKYNLAIKTNGERRRGGLREALAGADVLVAASTPGPGVIKKELITGMSRDPVVFVLANPTPEMWPWEAKEAGARIVATGRSDFPNQVNNSLLFPAMFRGVLDVRAKTITDDMVIAAAEELAGFAEEKMISEEYIIPNMAEWEVYPRVAARVAEKVVEQGVARRKLSREQAYGAAKAVVERSRRLLSALVDSGLIPLPQEDFGGEKGS